MPGFIRDVIVSNVVLNDDAIKDLHAIFLQRVNAHNENTVEVDRKLSPTYIVRFDNRGYRTFSADEAWGYYKNAESVERLVLQAESLTHIRSNRVFGEHIEIKLDCERQAVSHIVVGGDSKDWVEATFMELEGVLDRQKNIATALVRTQWSALVVQLIGVFFGLLLCLWLSTLSAPYLKDVEYPRALSFAFWFLVYSNLWTYIQQRTLAGLGALFPNVRFSRAGEHWTQIALRKGLELSGIALSLWILGWLTKWAASVIGPLMTSTI